MYNKILVPLDGSKRAETILPYVESLAKGYGADVPAFTCKIAGHQIALRPDEILAGRLSPRYIPLSQKILYCSIKNRNNRWDTLASLTV